MTRPAPPPPQSKAYSTPSLTAPKAKSPAWRLVYGDEIIRINVWLQSTLVIIRPQIHETRGMLDLDPAALLRANDQRRPTRHLP